ncbi:hypothetical protein [Acetobacter syzygii]|uniref:hypothetical protein n=1 Tax=Acetobacter syzygii TaxID=146476 RepID=UPI0039EB054C
MNVIHTRRQHAVGQGFFNSGDLHDENGWCRLRYVVDCGSKATYQSAREKQIDDFVSSIGSGGMIDLLLVSHVHEDHVNGIERLFDPSTGLKVDTIMLPLMTVQERLIAFARSVDEDSSSAASAFYQRFVIDPVAALSEFNPRHIILVRPGATDDAAPGSTDDPVTPLPGSEELLDPEDKEDRREWRFVGKRQLEDQIDYSTSSRAGREVRISVMPDSAGIAVPSKDCLWDWLIAPYVDPKVEAGIAQFERTLSRRLGIKVADLRKQLVNAAYVQNLIVSEVNKLIAAYQKVVSNLNVTSLCVYSGPAASPVKHECRLLKIKFGEYFLGYAGRGGWLGTGDAALKEKTRLDPFLRHYGRLLNEVDTLTMPHHGSDGNFHPDLLDKVEPTLCVAAADRISNWRHPGTSVVQSVASRGILLFVATADERSVIREQLYIHLP